MGQSPSPAPDMPSGPCSLRCGFLPLCCRRAFGRRCNIANTARRTCSHLQAVLGALLEGSRVTHFGGSRPLSSTGSCTQGRRPGAGSGPTAGGRVAEHVAGHDAALPRKGDSLAADTDNDAGTHSLSLSTQLQRVVQAGDPNGDDAAPTHGSVGVWSPCNDAVCLCRLRVLVLEEGPAAGGLEEGPADGAPLMDLLREPMAAPVQLRGATAPDHRVVPAPLYVDAQTKAATP